MFLLGGLLRLVINHHCTWFINSLAHMWGTQPYTDENTARDNGALAFLTFGEGYHNFHHIFQNDYRNGVRWWQWDPTKWLINTLSAMGLADNLKTVPDLWIQRAQLAMQFKRMEAALDKRRAPGQRRARRAAEGARRRGVRDVPQGARRMVEAARPVGHRPQAAPAAALGGDELPFAPARDRAQPARCSAAGCRQMTKAYA